MKRIGGIAIVLGGVIAVLTVLKMPPAVFSQGDDDYAAISRMTTLKERQEFFRGLTPERKSALWRKHYTTELTKHPELTQDQKAVVNLAIVMASPDLFTGKLPDAAGPGSIFEKALANAFKDDRALGQEIFGSPAPPLPRAERQQNSRSE
jgi:hypothetical protein